MRRGRRAEPRGAAGRRAPPRSATEYAVAAIAAGGTSCYYSTLIVIATASRSALLGLTFFSFARALLSPAVRPKRDGYCARMPRPCPAVLSRSAVRRESTRGKMLGSDWLHPYLRNPWVASHSRGLILRPTFARLCSWLV